MARRRGDEDVRCVVRWQDGEEARWWVGGEMVRW